MMVRLLWFEIVRIVPIRVCDHGGSVANAGMLFVLGAKLTVRKTLEISLKRNNQEEEALILLAANTSEESHWPRQHVATTAAEIVHISVEGLLQ